MSKQPKSHLKRLTTFDYINSAILLLVAVCCVYPFLYVFFVATTDGTYLARGEMTFLPMGFNLKAFGYILTNPRFNVFAGMRNSFLYTALGTLLAVACTYVTAYVLSRPRFKHRYWLMSLFIITWVFDAGIIPQYIIYNQFGFVNSPWVMIVPGAISTQFLIITKTFLEGIPNELEEAAVVDGASDIKILTRVFLPLSPTVLATTGLFYAVSIWNQYLIPQIYLKDDAIKTIQQVLKNVVITDGSSGTTFKNVVLDGVTLNQQNLKAAAIFIAMLPIICVYPFVQKYFKKGYAVYDFFLPGLMIDALERGSADTLAAWAQEILDKHILTVNMLGCHDGIPMLDLKGLLPEERIQNLIDLIVTRGGMVKNLHGQKNVYYQVNATYYSALGESDAKLLLARAIQLFMPGKPQVWYLDLFAGKNDCEAVARAGEGGHKEINRTNLTKVQIAEALEKPVVKKQLELLRLRRNCPAFAQGAKVQIESCGPELTIEWSCSGHVARLQANLQKLTYRVEIE